MRIFFLFYETPSAPASYPLGIGLLSALLKDKGHLVEGRYIHQHLDDPKVMNDIIDCISKFSPDLIGYSCTTPAFPYIRQIAHHIKQRTGLTAICGGPHPTLYPKEVLAAEGIDYICIGDGERAFPEFIECCEMRKDCSKIPGIRSKKKTDNLNSLSLYPLKRDIDALPWTDYEVFGKEFIKQLTAGGWLRCLSSRGCPYNCSYCHTPMFRKLYSKGIGVTESRMGYVRFRSVDSILAEISHLVSKYHLDVVNFMDDLFCMKKTRTLEFCRKFKVRIPDHAGYSIQTHLHHMDDEVIAALRNSRCLRVVVGVESGSPRILELLNRKTTPALIKNRLKSLVRKKFKYGTWSLNMLGMPTETKEDMLETLKLNAAVCIERAKFNILAPYRGSEIYDFCEENGLIKEEGRDARFSDRMITMLKFPDKEQAFLEKFYDIGHWYMNLYAPFGLSPAFSPLIKEIERISPGEWYSMRNKYLKIDREIMLSLSGKNTPHYDFVLKDKVSASTIGIIGVPVK